MDTLTSIFLSQATVSHKDQSRFEQLLFEMISNLVVAELDDNQIETFQNLLSSNDDEKIQDFILMNAPQVLTIVAEEMKALQRVHRLVYGS